MGTSCSDSLAAEHRVVATDVQAATKCFKTEKESPIIRMARR